jgi:IS5 family transposase
LADEALEDGLYDSQALRTFAGVDLSVEAVPDATTEEAEGNREAGGRASPC